MQQIPDWITMPDAKVSANNGIRARIIKMSQNIQKNKDLSVDAKSEKSRC